MHYVLHNNANNAKKIQLLHLLVSESLDVLFFFLHF